MILLNEKYLIIKKITLSVNHELRIAHIYPTQQKVVLKFFSQRKKVKCVEAEIKFMEKIKKHKSPYIINMIDSFEYNGYIVLVFPFYNKGDLFEIIKRKSVFPETKTKILIFQLLNGLKTIHDMGIIVRDIKPENILIDEDGSPIIIDFDLAVSINDMEKLDDGTYKDKIVCGTPDSMSPETYNRIYSFKTDVFSVGCVTYYLLTSYAVYSEDRKILTFKFEDNENIYAYDHVTGKRFPSENSKDFISKCLTVDVSKRPSIDELLNHPWFTESTLMKFRKRSSSMTRYTDIKKQKIIK